MTPRPIEIEAFYHLDSQVASRASLQLDCTTFHKNSLLIIHDCFYGDIHTYSYTGGLRNLQLTVTAGETLTIIGRQHGRVIGSLVNEICTDERSRLLLLPKGGYNILIHQQHLDDDQACQMFASHSDRLAAVSAEPGPATRLLSNLLEEAQFYYNTISREQPVVLSHLLPVLEEALTLGDEAYSSQMLRHLCSAVEELMITDTRQIKPLYHQAVELLHSIAP